MKAAESVEGKAESEIGKDGVKNKEELAADKRQEPAVPEEPQVYILRLGNSLNFLGFLGISRIL